MQFKEKLQRLTEGKNKSQLARAAGLSSTAITDYIQKEALPRCDVALRLARALGVPVEWLIDDSLGGDPPNLSVITTAITIASDEELMLEVARRYRRDLLRLASLLDELEAVDWRTADEDGLILKSTQLSFLDMNVRRLWDADLVAACNHAIMPAGGRSAEELSAAALQRRLSALRARSDVADWRRTPHTTDVDAVARDVRVALEWDRKWRAVGTNVHPVRPTL